MSVCVCVYIDAFQVLSLRDSYVEGGLCAITCVNLLPTVVTPNLFNTIGFRKFRSHAYSI